MSPVEQASTDTAGVLAPPPLVYAIPLLAGLLIQRSRPIQLVPAGMAAPIGVEYRAYRERVRRWI